MARRGPGSKFARKRLARAEMLMQLAMTADRWVSELAGTAPDVRPFEEWPNDEGFRVLARKYDLTKGDLVAIVRAVSVQAEQRAERAGYSETV